MFKFKPGINVSYDRQGYIYFFSMRYHYSSRERRDVIDDLCRKFGGEYWEALREFMTTEHTATAICKRRYLSRSTLYRAVKRYYEGFPDNL